jgi:hypothetical protein
VAGGEKRGEEDTASGWCASVSMGALSDLCRTQLEKRAGLGAVVVLTRKRCGRSTVQYRTVPYRPVSSLMVDPVVSSYLQDAVVVRKGLVSAVIFNYSIIFDCIQLREAALTVASDSNWLPFRSQTPKKLMITVCASSNRLL